MLAKKKGAAKDVIVMRSEAHLPRWENVLEEAPQVPTILIVDDLDLNRRLLKAMLKASTYRRLAAYSISLGQALGLSKSDQLALYRGGYLHDIGKVGIPDAILFKRGLLTEAEWQVMRQHTLRGEEICRPMKSLAPVLPIIRSH